MVPEGIIGSACELVAHGHAGPVGQRHCGRSSSCCAAIDRDFVAADSAILPPMPIINACEKRLLDIPLRMLPCQKPPDRSRSSSNRQGRCRADGSLSKDISNI